MKVLMVLTFDIPDPADVVPLLKAIDPPKLPYFAGQIRIVAEPHASAVESWLDDGEDLP